MRYPGEAAYQGRPGSGGFEDSRRYLDWTTKTGQTNRCYSTRRRDLLPRFTARAAARLLSGNQRVADRRTGSTRADRRGRHFRFSSQSWNGSSARLRQAAAAGVSRAQLEAIPFGTDDACVIVLSQPLHAEGHGRSATDIEGAGCGAAPDATPGPPAGATRSAGDVDEGRAVGPYKVFGPEPSTARTRRSMSQGARTAAGDPQPRRSPPTVPPLADGSVLRSMYLVRSSGFVRAAGKARL